MLCRPTKVAAASCQAFDPVSSHFGEGTSMETPPGVEGLRSGGHGEDGRDRRDASALRIFVKAFAMSPPFRRIGAPRGLKSAQGSGARNRQCSKGGLLRNWAMFARLVGRPPAGR